MKKTLFLVLFAALVSAAAFAELPRFALSAGAGGQFTVDFTSMSSGGQSETESFVGGGAYAFFDATFVQAELGILLGGVSQTGAPDSLSLTGFRAGLFGKYPIALGSMTLFPLLGIDGVIWLSGKMGDFEIPSESLSDAGQFWIKAGVGADINLSEKLYLRPQFLYGIRLHTKAEKTMLDNLPSGADASIFGHGLDIKIAVGYRF